MTWIEQVESQLRNRELARARLAEANEGGRIDLPERDGLINLVCAIVGLQESSLERLQRDQEPFAGEQARMRSAETKEENDDRYWRLTSVTRPWLIAHGSTQGDIRDHLEKHGDRFVLQRYGYVEYGERSAEVRWENQQRIIEAINQYEEDYRGVTRAVARASEVTPEMQEALDRRDAQTEFYAYWLAGHQAVNSSLLAATFARAAQFIWDDPSDQDRVTGVATFFANVEGMWQQRRLFGPKKAADGGKHQRSRSPRKRRQASDFGRLVKRLRARIGQKGAVLDHPTPVGGDAPAITRDERGRAFFEGFEIRGMRDMSHVSESTLREQARLGFATKDPMKPSDPLILHHQNQNPAGPLIEIPSRRHSISNPRQHPFGNEAGAGLTPSERAEFNAWRVRYWMARARGELLRRGLRL